MQRSAAADKVRHKLTARRGGVAPLRRDAGAAAALVAAAAPAAANNVERRLAAVLRLLQQIQRLRQRQLVRRLVLARLGGGRAAETRGAGGAAGRVRAIALDVERLSAGQLLVVQVRVEQRIALYGAGGTRLVDGLMLLVVGSGGNGRESAEIV